MGYEGFRVSTHLPFSIFQMNQSRIANLQESIEEKLVRKKERRKTKWILDIEMADYTVPTQEERLAENPFDCDYGYLALPIDIDK